MVGEVGLEPTKHYAADLQSAPFAARDIPPNTVSSPPEVVQRHLHNMSVRRAYGVKSFFCQHKAEPILRFPFSFLS